MPEVEDREFSQAHRNLAAQVHAEGHVLVIDNGPHDDEEDYDAWHETYPEPPTLPMHPTDAAQAVKADPDRYWIVPRAARLPITVEERLDAIERHLEIGRFAPPDDTPADDGPAPSDGIAETDPSRASAARLEREKGIKERTKEKKDKEKSERQGIQGLETAGDSNAQTIGPDAPARSPLIDGPPAPSDPNPPLYPAPHSTLAVDRNDPAP